MVLIPIAAKLGSMRHQQLRHVLDELHEAQFMSSPEGQGLGALDDIQVLATMKFLRACEDDRGNFNASRAETTLRRSEEHTSELQSLMRISYAVFCLKKKQKKYQTPISTTFKKSQARTNYT